MRIRDDGNDAGLWRNGRDKHDCVLVDENRYKMKWTRRTVSHVPILWEPVLSRVLTERGQLYRTRNSAFISI